MTKIITEQPLSALALDSAPVDSWLVESYGPSIKTIFDKQANGTWLSRGSNHGFGYSSNAMANVPHVLGPVEQTLHHPGLIKIVGKRVVPIDVELWWRWECQVPDCGDGSVSYFDPAVAHDSARKHLEYHAESGSSLATWSACVNCGESFPLADLAAHYAADHYRIGVEA